MVASWCGEWGGESTSSGQGRVQPASSRVQGVGIIPLDPRVCSWHSPLLSWTVGPPTLWFC